jgi:shikimate kinase
MGTGKSTLSRLLARKLRRPRIDTDDWITWEATMSIPEIFERFGEDAFRDIETQAARHVAGLRNHIVSTGGGILNRDENVRLLQSSGVLICLTARPEVIVARTSASPGRPLLQGKEDRQAEVARLLAERAARYALADWTVDTSEESLEEVVPKICERLPSLFREAATRF